MLQLHAVGVFNGHQLADSITADFDNSGADHLQSCLLASQQVPPIRSIRIGSRATGCEIIAALATAVMVRAVAIPVHGRSSVPQHVKRSFCRSIFRSTVHRCNTSLAMAIALYIVSKQLDTWHCSIAWQ